MGSSMAEQVPELQQRYDLEAAISKAVELRALHSALMHNTNAAINVSSMRLQPPGASPSSTRLSTQLSGEDYPVFTPSYDEERPPYDLCRPEAWNCRSTPLEGGLTVEEEEEEEEDEDEDEEEHHLQSLVQKLTTGAKDHRNNSPSLKQYHNPNPKMVPISEDERSINSARLNHHSSRYNTATTTNRTSIISRFLPRTFRRKSKSETSPANRMEYWDVESLKKEVLLANENRDAALAQASEMRASVEELRENLRHLENHCQDLKKVLKHSSRAFKSPARSSSSPMEVTHEAMVEGFLQMVSESRLSVKHLSRSLATHLHDIGSDELFQKLFLTTTIPVTGGRSGKVTRMELYKLEAMVNVSLYQDFENCVFRRDGSPRELEPGKERSGNFASFVALRNLRWSEVMRKGTRCYSEEFSGFCDRKMGEMVGVLGCRERWPEEILHGFFVAAKCLWLLHLLAFSFDPPLGIMRVEEGRVFDGVYMEDVALGSDGRQRGKHQHHQQQQQQQQQVKVKLMVAPGFYVENNRVFKSRVLCRRRNAT